MSAQILKFPGPDTCRRCGASEQATHHWACEDYTLTDSHVRWLIRREFALEKATGLSAEKLFEKICEKARAERRDDTPDDAA